jgi:hypothetical protein
VESALTALLAFVQHGVVAVALDVPGRVEALLHQVDRPGHHLHTFGLRQARGRHEAEPAGLQLAAGAVGQEVSGDVPGLG